jgi:cytidylate kinase
MSEKRIVIAIDGPAGAGKSTVARRVADRLGFVYINSGAMYRAVALWALRNGTDLDDMHRLEMLARAARIEFGVGDGSVYLNGENVTEALRTAEVSMAASRVSAVPGVRRALIPLQRGIAESSSVVMEGRDIGSVVFPDAKIKVYLDANPSERARRRALELQSRGEFADVEAVTASIRERDARDCTRQEAPLVQAPDAHFIDSTGLSLDEVEAKVLQLIRARLSNGKEVSR